VITRITQCYLLSTRLSTNGMNHARLYSKPHSIMSLRPVLISRPAEGRRLRRPGWLVIYRLRRWSATRRQSPIPVLAGPDSRVTSLMRPKPLALRHCTVFTGSIARSANLPVFSLLRGQFCTDGGEIWHGGGDLVPSSMPNFTPIGATIRV